MNKARIFALFAALLALASFPAGARAQEEAPPPAAPAAQTEPMAVGSQVPRFDIKDIYGRIIPAQQLEGWTVIYALGTVETVDDGVETIRTLAKERYRDDGLIFILIGDVSNYPRVAQGFVRKTLKKEYRKNIEDLKQKMDERGLEYNYDLRERIVMIADTKAELFDLFGISGMKETPHLFIVDGKHALAGHYTDYSEEVSQKLAETLGKRAAENKYDINMRGRKKQTWKYYVAGAALAWAIFK